ncbi:MAG: hypothetical protein EGR48_00460 [Lachnospiraceae bacterium]|jgi:hypothetical protein|nr:hypothetical protein [Lachnospiraceae bacterium]
MRNKFLKLSSNVIASTDNKGKTMYFSKVDSASTFQKLFHDEEASYGVSVTDIEVDMGNGATFTDAILMTHSAKTEDGSDMFLDVIISDLLGKFVSEWY